MNCVLSALSLLNQLGAANEAENALGPIYDALSLIGPYAISILLVCGLIYAIIIGVKFAKTEDSGERGKLQKALINGIVGFIVIIALVIILYAIREPLARWMNGN